MLWSGEEVQSLTNFCGVSGYYSLTKISCVNVIDLGSFNLSKKKERKKEKKRLKFLNIKWMLFLASGSYITIVSFFSNQTYIENWLYCGLMRTVVLIKISTLSRECFWGEVGFSGDLSWFSGFFFKVKYMLMYEGGFLQTQKCNFIPILF